MKKIFLFYFLVACTCLSAQNFISICQAATLPVIDGHVTASEWNGSDSVMVGNVKVNYLHNNDSLFFLFSGPLESAFRFPEVLLDVMNDKSQNWDSNDWWFHVSATDCYFNGQYGNYSGTCAADHSAWSAEQNFTNGPPNTDTVEISIPFSTIGISTGDTIGISFVTTNTANFWQHWPQGANRNNPSAWGTAVVSSCLSSISEYNSDDFKIYPQPATNRLELFSGGRQINAIAEIFSADGKLIRTEKLNGENTAVIHISELENGIYFLRLRSSGTAVTKSFVKCEAEN